MATVVDAPFTSANVFLLSNRSKVIRCNASAVAAHVVNNQALWNSAVEQLVSVSVRLDLATVDSDAAVTISGY
jgi:hypothetical protein